MYLKSPEFNGEPPGTSNIRGAYAHHDGYSPQHKSYAFNDLVSQEHVLNDRMNKQIAHHFDLPSSMKRSKSPLSFSFLRPELNLTNRSLFSGTALEKSTL